MNHNVQKVYSSSVHFGVGDVDVVVRRSSFVVRRSSFVRSPYLQLCGLATPPHPRPRGREVVAERPMCSFVRLLADWLFACLSVSVVVVSVEWAQNSVCCSWFRGVHHRDVGGWIEKRTSKVDRLLWHSSQRKTTWRGGGRAIGRRGQ